MVANQIKEILVENDKTKTNRSIGIIYMKNISIIC
jgi:hypothetical protein